MDDLDNVMTWVNDPEVTAYFAKIGHITRSYEEGYLEKLLASKTDIVFSILVDGDYAGQCSINQIDHTSEKGRIFMVLTRKYQGRGLARTVLNHLLHEAYMRYDLYKLWLIVRQDNEKGRYLYRRCGFSQLCVLENEYKVDGVRLNMIMMELQKPDYIRWHKPQTSI